MILHILTQAPDSSAAIQMQQAVGEHDAVLLIEEAVTAVLNPSWAAWQHCSSRIFLLSEDLVSRGLAGVAIKNKLPTLEVEGFVALTEQYEKAVTWY